MAFAGIIIALRSYGSFAAYPLSGSMVSNASSIATTAFAFDSSARSIGNGLHSLLLSLPAAGLWFPLECWSIDATALSVQPKPQRFAL